MIISQVTKWPNSVCIGKVQMKLNEYLIWKHIVSFSQGLHEANWVDLPTSDESNKMVIFNKQSVVINKHNKINYIRNNNIVKEKTNNYHYQSKVNASSGNEDPTVTMNRKVHTSSSVMVPMNPTANDRYITSTPNSSTISRQANVKFVSPRKLIMKAATNPAIFNSILTESSFNNTLMTSALIMWTIIPFTDEYENYCGFIEVRGHVRLDFISCFLLMYNI